MGSFSDFGQPIGTGTVLAQDPNASSALPSYLQRPSDGGAGFGETLTTLGLSAQITGGFLNAIGAGFAAMAQKEQQKSQALSADLQQSMANRNARQAEVDAQAILVAGREAVGQLTAQRGQERASMKVGAAARGVTGSSVEEMLASQDIIKEIDAMTINRNTVRAAGQARMQAVNSRNEGLMAGVSAGNLRRTARSINPLVAFNSAAMQGAGQLAVSYARSRSPRFNERSGR